MKRAWAVPMTTSGLLCQKRRENPGKLTVGTAAAEPEWLPTVDHQLGRRVVRAIMGFTAQWPTTTQRHVPFLGPRGLLAGSEPEKAAVSKTSLPGLPGRDSSLLISRGGIKKRSLTLTGTLLRCRERAQITLFPTLSFPPTECPKDVVS